MIIAHTVKGKVSALWRDINGTEKATLRTIEKSFRRVNKGAQLMEKASRGKFW